MCLIKTAILPYTVCSEKNRRLFVGQHTPLEDVDAQRSSPRSPTGFLNQIWQLATSCRAKVVCALLSGIRELKQKRKRRLQKRHLKSAFSLLQTALSPLFHLVFWSWIQKGCIKVQEKKRKSLSCVHVLHETVKLDISTSQLCSDSNEMYKMLDTRAKLLFC